MTALLLKVLRFRHLIARLGERDLFGWWDCEAGSEAGLYLLQRLFPRTARWVACDLAVRSARVRHQALVPPVPCVHLFDLGPKNEARLADLFLSLKAQGAEEVLPPVLPPTVTFQGVGQTLAACGLDPVAGDIQERTVSLGDVTPDQLDAPEQLASQLAAAYGYSRPGQVVVPYFRLVGGP